MVFRVVDIKTHGNQQFTGPDTAAPGDLAVLRRGCFFKLLEVLLHDRFEFFGAL
jgi:hypothetical protein